MKLDCIEKMYKKKFVSIFFSIKLEALIFGHLTLKNKIK